MAIERTDLKYQRSAIWNDTSANGGEMSGTAIVDAVSGNIFPTVAQAERLAGSSKRRKVFVKNSEATGLTLYNAKIYIENPTPANDVVTLHAATLTDTQATALGRAYGCGWLNAPSIIGAESIAVLVEDGATSIFVIGDTIRISNKVNVDAVEGVEEYVTISTVTVSGDVATITFTPALENAFSSTNKATKVASLLSLGDIVASATTPTVTSTNGVFNHTTYPIAPNNIGSIRQNWTLTFVNSTTYSIVGDTVGNLGSGTIGGGASPFNPLLSVPYWTINPNAFSGAFVTGNSLTFTTAPSAKAVWFNRDVPANTPSYSGNAFVAVIEGESE